MMMLRIGQYSYFLIAIFTTISISCSNPDPADLRVKLSRYVSNSDSGVSKKQSNQLINYFLMLKPEKILTSDRMLIAAAFVYRYAVSFPLIRNKMALNAFHFLLYFISLEVIPLLIILKLLFRKLNVFV